MMLTVAELQAETLSQKHKRLMQEKCPHEEIYTSSVWCRDEEVTYQNRFCLDCGKSWHNAY